MSGDNLVTILEQWRRQNFFRGGGGEGQGEERSGHLKAITPSSNGVHVSKAPGRQNGFLKSSKNSVKNYNFQGTFFDFFENYENSVAFSNVLGIYSDFS